MPRKHISLITNVDKTQIIDNGKYFELRGVPVTVDDAVMNGLLYSAEENEKGMHTLIDRVVTLSHPTNKDGQSVDAYNGDALMEHFSGGIVKNTYSENGVRKADIRISKAKLKAADDDAGTDFTGMLNRKEDIGVSTGLYTLATEEEGTNSKGEAYSGKATNQDYNHLAMLTSDEPPAGGEDTFMRFNSGGDDSFESIVVNLCEHIDTQSQEVSEEDKQTMVNKLLTLLGLGKFANSQSTDYNKTCKDKFTPENNEDLSMAHKEALADVLGINAEEIEALSDDELKAKLNGLKGDSPDEPATNADAKALAKLTEQVEAIANKLDSQVNAKRENLLTDLKANTKHGLSESMLNKLDDAELQELHDKHVATTNGLNGNAAGPGDVDAEIFKATMPGQEA